MSAFPETVHIMEVGPRDGLQIEPKILALDEKLELITALADAGLKEIEIASFVNPKAVPQMAGSGEVVEAVPERDGVRYRALWLNARGLERAIAFKKLHLTGTLTIIPSETFAKRNTNRSIAEGIADMLEWIDRYEAAGVPIFSIGVMAAFGCNFEGLIPPERIVTLIEKVEGMMNERGHAFTSLTLADTMGWGNPRQVKQLLGAIQNRWPEVSIKLHLHDTRGTAMANAVAAMEMGVREFDASIGGMGGCPFAGNPGAAGNISTEDLAFMCQEFGIETGLDMDALVAAARLAERLVGHPLPGKVMNSTHRRPAP